jgi:hypothetical protein
MRLSAANPALAPEAGYAVTGEAA